MPVLMEAGAARERFVVGHVAHGVLTLRVAPSKRPRVGDESDHGGSDAHQHSQPKSAE